MIGLSHQRTEANTVARWIMVLDPNSEEDRAAYRQAKARLEQTLPANTDVRAVISQAVRESARADIRRIISTEVGQ